MKAWLRAVIVAIGIVGYSGTAQADSCSSLGSNPEARELAACIKVMHHQIEDLEREIDALRRQAQSRDTVDQRDFKDMQKFLSRLERYLENQGDVEFVLQCRQAYGSCSYGQSKLSTPGSEAGVCCSVVRQR